MIVRAMKAEVSYIQLSVNNFIEIQIYKKNAEMAVLNCVIIKIRSFAKT